MGEAKRRGTREERIAHALARDRSAEERRALEPLPPAEWGRMQARLAQLWDGLTTPVEIGEQVQQFAQSLSERAPIYLDCQPELWSRQSCCDLNVRRYVELHGGRALCGYRIWYNGPLYIEAERHAVWTDGNAVRDVSFVDSGETTVLFVPDDLDFEGAPRKVRFAFDHGDLQILQQYELMESRVPFIQATDEQAWETMPTYEEWLSGRRMPNLMQITGAF